MIKQITFTLLNRCWQLIAFIIILFAVLMTVARFMIPSLNDYKQSLEKIVFEKTGIPISIGHLEGTWESLGPVLKIKNIQVAALSENAEGSEFSSIKEIQIKVATFPTLFYQTLVTEQLTIRGLSLNIKQDNNSELTLTGITTASDEATAAEKDFISIIQNWLQHQSHILLFDTHLNINLQNESVYPVVLDTIQFNKGKNIYQLIGLSKIPGNNQIAFTLEADGFLSDPHTKGKLYIDTYKITMPDLPLNSIWQEVDILSGSIELKLWADWKNSHFESATLSLAVNDFLLSLKGEPQSKLNKVNGYLVWERLIDGWKVESKNIELISQDRSWPDPSLLIEMKKNKTQRTYSFSASSLDLGVWADLFLTNPNITDDLRNQIFTMNPNGFINDALVTASFVKEELQAISAQGDFVKLTWNPWQKIPGVTNISGDFVVHKNTGHVSIESSAVDINYPAMFRWPLTLDNLTSEFSWQLSDHKNQLLISSLNIEVLGAQLLADGLISHFQDRDYWDLNIYSELNKVDLSQIKKLLPTGIMSSNLTQYLDNSIKSGLLDSTKIAIRGKASDFPFNNPEGVFIIQGLLTDTEFVFYDGWPEIKDLTAELIFLEKSLEVQLSHGNSDGIILSNTSAIIDDLGADDSILTVINESKGDFIQGINYINNSPLKDSVGVIFDVIPTQGPFSINLDLTIPLGNEDTIDKVENESNIQVNGIINLANNSLIVKPLDLKIDNIQGAILINDSLISGKNLTANVLGDLSEFSIAQHLNTNQAVITQIESKGAMTIKDLRNTFPDWMPQSIQGETQYQLNILFPEVVDVADPIMSLSIKSDLRGIKSKLPAPFAKQAANDNSFHLNYQLLNGETQLFHAQIENLVDMKLHTSEQLNTRGQIIFGEQLAKVPTEAGIEITGTLSQFDLNTWLAASQLNSSEQENFKAADYSHFYVTDLLIDNFNYYFLNFNQVSISADILQDSFLFKLAGNEISGEIKIPDINLNQVIDINLATLKIKDQFPTLGETQENLDEPSRSSETDSISHYAPLPPIKIQCQECVYNDKKFAATVVNITPLEMGNAFTVNIKDKSLLGLNITGDWSKNGSGEVITQFSGSLNSNNLGNLLSVFNLNSGIRDTSISAQGGLSWQGDLTQINFKSLTGNILLDGGKGSQKYVSDRGARLFSILSLGSLARKLTLDFSDLFEDGFFYTDFKATVDIQDGVFRTNDFKITGTSADVEIIGSSDFVNNRIENCILVNPDLSASLPILAGWAIEPVTGLVVFLMSKIFQPALRVVTAIQYKVEGSFENPVITEIGKSAGTAIVDNTGETASTFVKPDPEQQKFSCDGAFGT
ncbi:MAG: TIGR02099 family protein [Gammaproteobacteria bacterium]|nr:MAG: TIGR02099 family protein [Gammaproteobacteria bacterium]